MNAYLSNGNPLERLMRLEPQFMTLEERERRRCLPDVLSAGQIIDLLARRPSNYSQLDMNAQLSCDQVFRGTRAGLHEALATGALVPCSPVRQFDTMRQAIKDEWNRDLPGGVYRKNSWEIGAQPFNPAERVRQWRDSETGLPGETWYPVPDYNVKVHRDDFEAWLRSKEAWPPYDLSIRGWWPQLDEEEIASSGSRSAASAPYSDLAQKVLSANRGKGCQTWPDIYADAEVKTCCATLNIMSCETLRKRPEIGALQLQIKRGRRKGSVNKKSR